MQRPEVQLPAASRPFAALQVEVQSGLIKPAETGLMVVEWNGYLLLAPRVHAARSAFRDSTHVLS